METVKKGIRRVRRISHKPVDHPLGFTVAVSGALMQMMTYGIDNSFSAFSNSMQNDPTLGFPSATTVSFGNSVSLGLSPVFGVLAGFLVDRLPPRLMMFISTALLFMGLWLSASFATSSAAVTGSYCLLASISSAFMLSPGAAATGSWFRRRAGLAQGINFCGGGIGSAWIPAVLGQWIEPYGWRKTFKLMSCFCAFGLLACVFSCRRHEPAPRTLSDSNVDGDNEGEGSEENEGTDAGEAVEPCAHESFTSASAAGGVRVSSIAATNVGRGAELDDDAIIEDLLEGEERARPKDVEGKSETEGEAARESLEYALHTRHLRPMEIVRVLLSVKFLANFFMWAIFGWAFYGMIYVTVPYVSSMGAAGTVYAGYPAISTAKASTVFTFWGVFQIFGSILVGALGSFTNDAFAYCACASVGAVVCAFLSLCRTYAAFAACLSVIGFCTAGMFAVMPALIAQSFYGPNLGFFIGCVFVAGCLGGFSSPPIQAQLQEKNYGNYSFGCLVISACMTVPGVICYACLWPDKQSHVARWLRARREGLRSAKGRTESEPTTPVDA